MALLIVTVRSTFVLLSSFHFMNRSFAPGTALNLNSVLSGKVRVATTKPPFVTSVFSVVSAKLFSTDPLRIE